MTRKYLMVMSAVLFGIIMAFSGCKNNKHLDYDEEDDEETTEQVDKKKEKKKDKKKKKQQKKEQKKTVSIEDLDDLNLEDFDLESMSMESLDDLDVENITKKQANNLLKLVVAVAPSQLPMDMGDGMTMTAIALEGDDLAFHAKVDASSLGMSMADFEKALAMPEVKKSMMSSLTKSGDDDLATFIKVTKVSGKNFAIKFVDAQSGEMATIRLTNEELQKVVK